MLKLGFKIYGKHLLNIKILENFIKKYSKFISVVQINFSLLESYNNKHLLRNILISNRLQTIIHVDSEYDIFFINKIVSQYNGINIVGIVVHDSMALECIEAKKYLYTLLYNNNYFLSIENTHHTRKYCKNVLQLLPFSNWCLDIGHNNAYNSKLNKSKSICKKINMIHLHRVTNKRHHLMPGETELKETFRIIDKRGTEDINYIIIETKDILKEKKPIINNLMHKITNYQKKA